MQVANIDTSAPARFVNHDCTGGFLPDQVTIYVAQFLGGRVSRHMRKGQVFRAIYKNCILFCP